MLACILIEEEESLDKDKSINARSFIFLLQFNPRSFMNSMVDKMCRKILYPNPCSMPFSSSKPEHQARSMYSHFMISFILISQITSEQMKKNVQPNLQAGDPTTNSD